MPTPSLELLECIRVAREAGELDVRFEGHDPRMEQEPIWIHIKGKRDGKLWELKAELGNGTKWQRQVTDESLGGLVASFHAMFTRMGLEMPKA